MTLSLVPVLWCCPGCSCETGTINRWRAMACAREPSREGLPFLCTPRRGLAATYLKGVAVAADPRTPSTHLEDELAPEMADLAHDGAPRPPRETIELDLRRAHGAGVNSSAMRS